MTQVNYDEYEAETLARWAYEFNHWEYPDDFPIPAPDGWDLLPCWNTDETKYPLTREDFPYHKEIMSIIGRKELLRYVHTNHIGVENWQFEVWWFLNGCDSLDVFKKRYFDIYTTYKWRKYRD